MLTYLGLGSNIGDRAFFINEAISILSKNNISINKRSDIYETKPMYYTDQNNFFNQVIEADIKYSPIQLLKIIKEIESGFGRDLYAEKNTKRELDIDILSIENLIFKNKVLSIPHSSIHERIFVLKPWSDIAPNYIIPKYEISVNELLIKLNNSIDNLNIFSKIEEVI